MKKPQLIIEIKKGQFIGATSTSADLEVLVVDHDLDPEQLRVDITTPVDVKVVPQDEFETIQAAMWHKINP